VIPCRYGNKTPTRRGYARKRNELAQRAGMSKHEAVLHAIDEEYNRMTHRQRVTDALNQSVERWGDALERLGQ